MTIPDRIYDTAIHWTDKGTATVTASTRAGAVHHLDDATTPAQAGDTITITEEPVLITSTPTPREQHPS